MVQVYGLSRVRGSPFDFSLFDSLKGFSYYELHFIQNHFANSFLDKAYTENVIDSAVFAFGTQNFIINFGSLFYFLLAFEGILMVYFCYLKYK